jgi:hypothetical protein
MSYYLTRSDGPEHNMEDELSNLILYDLANSRTSFDMKEVS